MKKRYFSLLFRPLSDIEEIELACMVARWQKLRAFSVLFCVCVWKKWLFQKVLGWNVRQIFMGNYYFCCAIQLELANKGLWSCELVKYWRRHAKADVKASFEGTANLYCPQRQKRNSSQSFVFFFKYLRDSVCSHQ